MPALTRNLGYARPVGRARRPLPSRRLTLEPLEDRCLLSQTIFPFYEQVNVFSDVRGEAQNLDAGLINAWGIAVGPRTAWVSSGGAGTSVVYRGGVTEPWVNTGLVVAIPGEKPTGQVFNPTSDFVISDGMGHSGASIFIFASENGTITGWNPAVPPVTQARLGTTVADAIFKGIALGSNEFGNFLYATDFHNNRIDVFDRNFNLLPTHELLPHRFTDSSLPEGYAPFGIQNIGGKLYVSYALQDDDAEDDVPGAGHGFIDVYSTEGVLLQRLVRHTALNSPWGMALAPSDFGFFSGDLLVSNFGDGRISAYDIDSGHIKGYLLNTDHQILSIDGLWGIAFGNGTTAGQTNQLLFSAGPEDEAHGLFGYLQVSPEGIMIPGGASATAAAKTASRAPSDTALGNALLGHFIGDGRSGLSVALPGAGALAGKPVGNSTGGHPVFTSAMSSTTDAFALIPKAAHGGTDVTTRAIDALFAAAHFDGGL